MQATLKEVAHMAERGLPVPEDSVALVLHTVAGYRAGRLLQAATLSTAVLCIADLLTPCALCALDEAGLQVPRDLSVVGFDDIPLAAYATPPLTTVGQPIAALACTAATLLLNRIAEDPASGRNLRELRGPLLVRARAGRAAIHGAGARSSERR